MKKIFILLICIALIASAAIVPVYAENPDESSYTVQTETDISEDSSQSGGFDLEEILMTPIVTIAALMVSLPIALCSPLLFVVLPPLGVSAAVLPIIALTSPTEVLTLLL